MQMRLFLGLIFAFAVSAASAADRDHYTKPSMTQYPFSSAVVVGDTIYLSGEIGLTEDGALAEGGVGPQTTQIFKNYEKTLAEVGSSLEDIVKCTVFLEDMAKYGEMNVAYAAALPDPKPARSTFGVDGLALGAALEIECLAIKKTK